MEEEDRRIRKEMLHGKWWKKSNQASDLIHKVVMIPTWARDIKLHEMRRCYTASSYKNQSIICVVSKSALQRWFTQHNSQKCHLVCTTNGYVVLSADVHEQRNLNDKCKIFRSFWYRSWSRFFNISGYVIKIFQYIKACDHDFAAHQGMWSLFFNITGPVLVIF